MFAELAASRDLLPCDCGLLAREKPGTRFTPYGLSQAEVGAVTGFGVGGAGATGLAAPNGAFGNRAAAHGLWLRQCCGEIANLGGDIGRSGHALSYNTYFRKINPAKTPHAAILIILACTLRVEAV